MVHAPQVQSTSLLRRSRLAVAGALGLAACLLASCVSPPDQVDIGPPSKSAAVARALEPLTIEDGRLRVTGGQDRQAWPQPDRDSPDGGALTRGLRWAERGRALEALPELAGAVAADPDAPEAYLPLARVLRRLHALDHAAAALRQLLSLDPRRANAHFELGMVLTAAGDRRAAVRAFEALLAVDPASGAAHARLAALHTLLNQPTAAGFHRENARRLGASLPSALTSLLDKPQPPGRETRPAPGLAGTTVGAAVRLDASGSAQAAETSISGTGDRLVAAWNDQRDGGVSGVWRLGGAFSDDGGATWTEGLLRPPGAVQADFEGDPMSAFDRRTGDAWIGGVTFFSGGSVFVARRRSDAPFFDAPLIVNNDPELTYDKPLMAVGPGPGEPDSTRLYVTFSEGLQSSGDFGATWSPVVELGEPLVEIAYQPQVDDAGVLSIVSWDSGDTVWLRRSADGGATVGPRSAVATRLDVWGLQDSTRVPGQFRAPSLPSLAVDGDGTLFVAYCDTTSIIGGDANLDLYFTRSDDGGGTWTPPAVLNSDAATPGDQFAPWLIVDRHGRLHVLFFDTRFTAQSDDDAVGFVDVSYAFSDDGGASWHETRVTEVATPSDEAVWEGGPGVPDYQFLGDYLGLTALDGGDVVVTYPAGDAGDLDVFARRLTPPLFVDGFESGGTQAWSVVFGEAP